MKDTIHSRLKRMPAVALLGPRQVGKTTLAKTFSSLYYDLELEEERLRLDIQWNDVVRSNALVVLDEAQNYPALFPLLRSAIDTDRERNGRFLILGSVSPALMRNVAESLTGRIALCELHPFSLGELGIEKADTLWLMGGYPDGGIRKERGFPVWQRDYLDLLAMRDLPLWGLPAKPQATMRFFRMLAASHGTLWNASRIGKSLGISYHTANTYLDYLEQSYLIRRLQPYHTNIGKRLIKSPKVYWRDTGLLHSILHVPTIDELISQPWVGASWESWVIEQTIIHLNNRDVHYDGPFFLRTSDGRELDLVLIVSGRVWAIEVKLSSMPGKGDLQSLNRAADLIGADMRVLVSRTKKPVIGDDTVSTDLAGFLGIVA